MSGLSKQNYEEIRLRQSRYLGACVLKKNVRATVRVASTGPPDEGETALVQARSEVHD